MDWPVLMACAALGICLLVLLGAYLGYRWIEAKLDDWECRNDVDDEG